MRAIPWFSWLKVALVYFVSICVAGAIVSVVNPYVGLGVLAVLLTLTAVLLGPTVRRRSGAR